MNGIDSALASVLSSRIESLLNIAPGSATTAQTGAAGVGTAPAPATPNTTPAPPASTQTALSAVALTLDAIARSGGEATPAVLGQAPIWAAAPALDVAMAGAPQPDAAANANTAIGTAANSTANGSAAANATAATAASVAAAEVPVAALAAALQQTVSDSGLFYESHLAAWLAGQRSPGTLADEAQNRLIAAAQLPPEWADGDDGAPARGSGAWPGAAGGASDGMAGAMPRGMQGGAASPQAGAQTGAQAGPPNGAAGNNPAHAMPSILTAQAARQAAGDVLANSLADLGGQPAHAALHTGASQPADAGSSQNAQSMAAAVHPATVPLVRQQLDLLATGQFRWTGEAWPGARLDWTIEQDGDEWDRSGGGLTSEDGQPWRTRLTLSLPTLGTVDAELTLTGMQLVARVQANPHGAARLASQGESLRRRLAAAGIELQGLTIREIGGGAPGTSAAGANGTQAASAYARSAAAAAGASGPAAAGRTGGRGPANARGSSTGPREDFDWDI